MSCYRDPQLDVSDNYYSYRFNWRPNICKSVFLITHFIPINSNFMRLIRLQTTLVIISVNVVNTVSNELSQLRYQFFTLFNVRADLSQLTNKRPVSAFSLQQNNSDKMIKSHVSTVRIA